MPRRVSKSRKSAPFAARFELGFATVTGIIHPATYQAGSELALVVALVDMEATEAGPYVGERVQVDADLVRTESGEYISWPY